MNRHTSPIDHRPFQTKAKLESQEALELRYGAVAIREVADALHHLKQAKSEHRPVAAAA